MFPLRDHNPSDRIAFVTYALMAINIAVFVYSNWILGDGIALQRLYYDYALIPARLSDGENPAALFTSMFLHGGFMHLAGNMLFLWIFGDNLEDSFGHVGFLVFYTVCGLSAGLAQYVADPQTQAPMIGASGAIAGVMGGYLLLFPKAKVDILIILVIFFRIIPIPAWIMLILWFGLQVVNGLAADLTNGGVAYWAHAGGFVVGFVLTIPQLMRLGGRGFWARSEGHPPHPDAQYPFSDSRIPKVPRKR